MRKEPPQPEVVTGAAAVSFFSSVAIGAPKTGVVAAAVVVGAAAPKVNAGVAAVEDGAKNAGKDGPESVVPAPNRNGVVEASVPFLRVVGVGGVPPTGAPKENTGAGADAAAAPPAPSISFAAASVALEALCWLFCKKDISQPPDVAAGALVSSFFGISSLVVSLSAAGADPKRKFEGGAEKGCSEIGLSSSSSEKSTAGSGDFAASWAMRLAFARSSGLTTGNCEKGIKQEQG